jgi:DNA-directed RNA polymerase subunit K/omega
MTKYQRARAVGARAVQLSMGAQPLVDVGEETDAMRLAIKELEAGCLPLVFRVHEVDAAVFHDWPAAELNLGVRPPILV